MESHVLIENVLRSILEHVHFSIFEYITSTEMDKRRNLRDKIEAVLTDVSDRNAQILAQRNIQKKRVDEENASRRLEIENHERRVRNIISAEFADSFQIIHADYVQCALRRMGITGESPADSADESADANIDQQAEEDAPLCIESAAEVLPNAGESLNREQPEPAEATTSAGNSTEKPCPNHVYIPPFPSVTVLDVFYMGCSYFENEEVIRLSLEGIEKMIIYDCIRCVCLEDDGDYACHHCDAVFRGSHRAWQTFGKFPPREVDMTVKNPMKTLTKCSCEHCSLLGTLFNHAIFPILSLTSEKPSSRAQFSQKVDRSTNALLVQVVRVILSAVSNSLLHSVLLCEAISVLVEIAVGKHDEREEVIQIEQSDAANRKDSQLLRQHRKLFVIEEVVKLRIETLQVASEDVEINDFTYSSENVYQAIQPLFEVIEDGESFPVSTLFFLPAIAFSALKQVVLHVLTRVENGVRDGRHVRSNPTTRAEKSIFIHIHDLFSMINFFCTKTDFDSLSSCKHIEVFDPESVLGNDFTFEAINAHYKNSNVIKFLNDLISIPSSFKQTIELVFFAEYASFTFRKVQQSLELAATFAALYPVHCTVHNWSPLFCYLTKSFLSGNPLFYNPGLTCLLPSFLHIITNRIAYVKHVGNGSENSVEKENNASLFNMINGLITSYDNLIHVEFKKYTETFLMLYIFPAFLHERTSSPKRLCILEALRKILVCGGISPKSTSWTNHGHHVDAECKSKEKSIDSKRAIEMTPLFNIYAYFDCDVTTPNVTTHVIGTLCCFITLLRSEILQEIHPAQPSDEEIRPADVQDNISRKRRALVQEVRKGLILSVLDIFTQIFQKTEGLKTAPKVDIKEQNDTPEDDCAPTTEAVASPDNSLVLIAETAEATLLDSIVREKSLKTHLADFVLIFNKGKASKVIEFMKTAMKSFVARCEDDRENQSHCEPPMEFSDFFALHLLAVNGLFPDHVGAFLSEPESEDVKKTLSSVCASLPTAGQYICRTRAKNSSEELQNAFSQVESRSISSTFLLDIEHSFRTFLRSCPLPKEGQKIERIVEPFCMSWFQKSKVLYGLSEDQKERQGVDFDMYFPDSDAVYLLAFAMLMLNTELHSRVLNNAPKKPIALQDNEKYYQNQSFTQFYQQLQFVDGLKHFSQDEMVELYRRIERKEFQRRKEIPIDFAQLISQDEAKDTAQERYSFPPFAQMHTANNVNNEKVSSLDTIDFLKGLLNRMDSLEACSTKEVGQFGHTHTTKEIDASLTISKEPIYTGTVIGTYIKELDYISREYSKDYFFPADVSVPHRFVGENAIPAHRFRVPLLPSAIELQSVILDVYHAYHEYFFNRDAAHPKSRLVSYWWIYHKFVTAYLRENRSIQSELHFIRALPKTSTSSGLAEETPVESCQSDGGDLSSMLADSLPSLCFRIAKTVDSVAVSAHGLDAPDDNFIEIRTCAKTLVNTMLQRMSSLE